MNIYCYLINGFNDKVRKQVDNTKQHIVEHYPKMRAIDAYEIIGLFPTEQIRDMRIAEYIHKYNYCKMFPAVPPFEGGYDNQPKDWKELSCEIQYCNNELNKLDREMHGGQIQKRHHSKGKRR